MHELEYKTYDNEKGEVIEKLHAPFLIFASPDGTYGFRSQPHFTIMEYVGRKDRNGKKIYTGMILCQPLLNDFDSYIPGGIVEVFWCKDDIGYEVRDPSGKSTDHWSINPDAEILAINYKQYLLTKN